MEWTLLIGAGVVVLAVVLAVLRVRQLNQPHTARPAGDRPTGGSPPPYYTRRAPRGGGTGGSAGGRTSGRADEIRAAKARIDAEQADGPAGHLMPVQRRVALTLETLPDRTRRKVERLLKQDRAASAINTIRDDTGAGLNEARRIIADLRDAPPAGPRPDTATADDAAPGPSDDPQAPRASRGPGAMRDSGTRGPGDRPDDAEVTDLTEGLGTRETDAPEGGFAQHARALKAQGRTEAAVRLVVRETGMSEDEAEAFVAALDAR
ncbi:MAG: hypothetical protein GEV11_15780 [Streptosporangiales bacterium]|nr:hypothetical protein [Streptosporangiales bacterium]